MDNLSLFVYLRSSRKYIQIGFIMALREIKLAMDYKKKDFITDLRDVVCIPSISALRDKHYELVRVSYWFEDRLRKLGARTEMCYQEVHPDEPVEVPDSDHDMAIPIPASAPPVLLAWAGHATRRRTICVYCHLDVHPVENDSVWKSDPFRLTERDNALFGRGVSASKGPALCWLHVLEAYKRKHEEPPVNLRIIFDTAAEVGSPGLEAVLREHRRQLLRDVEFVCATLGQRTGKNLCACHGARGLCYFHLSVRGPTRDAHSGSCGGIVHEPLGDLLYLLDSLQTKTNRIAVSDLMDDVVQPPPDEEKTYSKIDFDHDQLHGSKDGDTKTRVLMQRWRLPCISFHGIEGAFSDVGGRPVIPRAVVGKFSVRLVPNQRCERVVRCIKNHLDAMWRLRNSPNHMDLHVSACIEPWIESGGSRHLQSALRALQLLQPEVEPDPARLGIAVPGIPVLQTLTGRSAVVLPIGGPNDNARGHNENMTIHDYMTGHHIVASYMQEIATMK